MRAGEVAFVGALAREVPELLPLLQEHLDDYDGLLPHVWLGDVTRWAIQQFKANPADPSLKKTLKLMEQTLSREGAQAEQELVSASFVENLPRPDDAEAGILEMAGPSVRAQLRLRG